MINKKTSRKQKTSKNYTPKLTKVDPDKFIRKMTKEDLVSALAHCLGEGDPDSFKEILWGYLLVHNKADIARKMKISRTTLYHLVSKKGNPTLNVLAKLIGNIAA